jgi:hypothetical protein
MKRTAVLAAAALLGIALVGCKPKAGASCKIETKEVCVEDKKALVCHDGKWEEMSCRGDKGCQKSGSDSTCDQSVAEEKDVCNLIGDFVCTADKKGMLECKGNRWTFVQSCLGERACVMEQKKVTCDNSVANLNDTCREEDDYACAPDKKSALVCRSGKFVTASKCSGKNGCRVTGDKASGYKVECDDSIANIGDPCEKDGHYACAPDEKQIVKCVNKKFVADDKCKGKDKCAVRGEQVGCY